VASGAEQTATRQSTPVRWGHEFDDPMAALPVAALGPRPEDLDPSPSERAWALRARTTHFRTHQWRRIGAVAVPLVVSALADGVLAWILVVAAAVAAFGSSSSTGAADRPRGSDRTSAVE
jgi:hypothetical protein